MSRKIRNQIDGILLLDKPLGISSNQAINKVKYLLNATKVGHTGTLDPMATGLLPVCLGEATKFASYLLDGDKEYHATMQLGVVTDTGDAEGKVIAQNNVNVSLELIQLALGKFVGEIDQIPPMYSALKYNGQPLYEYARAGITIERQARKVSIYELELVNYDRPTQQVEFRALVSKGTYIRTLAEDIGNLLGCGASLVALRRTRTNQFSINDAITIEKIAEDISNLPLLPIDSILPDLNSYQINDEQYIKVGHGNVCEINEQVDSGKYRLYYHSKFLGVAEIVKDSGISQLRPKRMVQQIP